MRTIRASEFSAFHYCQRAWWYAQHGEPNAKLAELAAGTQHHEKHARSILRAGFMQIVATALLLLSLVLLIYYLLS